MSDERERDAAELKPKPPGEPPAAAACPDCRGYGGGRTAGQQPPLR